MHSRCVLLREPASAVTIDDVPGWQVSDPLRAGRGAQSLFDSSGCALLCASVATRHRARADQLSSEPGASFQFGRTSTHLPPRSHFPHFTLVRNHGMMNTAGTACLVRSTPSKFTSDTVRR